MAVKFLRHSKTGALIWQIDWWPDGRNGKRKYGRVEGTREEAEMAEAAVKEGAGLTKGSSHVVTPRVTLEEALPEYLRWHRLNRMPRTHADTLASMPRLMSVFGRFITSQIKPSHITDFVSLRPERRRANQKDIHYLQGFVSWMVKNDHGKPLSFRPETPKYHRPLPTVPTTSEVDSVLAFITDPITRALIHIMWGTGARISTANQIRWESINWERSAIIATIKGGRPLILPLHEEVRDILHPLRKTSGWVFLNEKTGNPILSIKKTLATASRKAGLPYTITHHKFRHAYATDTLTATGDLRLVQSALGHRDIQTTTIYTQIQTSRLVDAHSLVAEMRKKKS